MYSALLTISLKVAHVSPRFWTFFIACIRIFSILSGAYGDIPYILANLSHFSKVIPFIEIRLYGSFCIFSIAFSPNFPYILSISVTVPPARYTSSMICFWMCVSRILFSTSSAHSSFFLAARHSSLTFVSLSRNPSISSPTRSASFPATRGLSLPKIGEAKYMRMTCTSSSASSTVSILTYSFSVIVPVTLIGVPMRKSGIFPAHLIVLPSFMVNVKYVFPSE